MNSISNVKLILQDGVPMISHIIIAENVCQKPITVRKLIDNQKEALETFGNLSFEMTGLNRTTKDGKNRGEVDTKTYYLNEQQSTLLLTMMKNTQRIVNFKVALVKAFFEMREKLLNSNNLLGQNFKLRQRVAELEKENIYIKELAILHFKEISIKIEDSLNHFEIVQLNSDKSETSFKFLIGYFEVLFKQVSSRVEMTLGDFKKFVKIE